MSGSSIPNINTSTLCDFLDCYIETVEHIATIVCLYNPIILVGLPLDEKFGLNGPFSGFHNLLQAEQTNKIIPICFKEFFEILKTTDEEIKGICEWINNMSRLTEEDVNKQIAEHELLMNETSKLKNDNI